MLCKTGVELKVSDRNGQSGATLATAQIVFESGGGVREVGVDVRAADATVGICWWLWGVRRMVECGRSRWMGGCSM